MRNMAPEGHQVSSRSRSLVPHDHLSTTATWKDDTLHTRGKTQVPIHTVRTEETQTERQRDKRRGGISLRTIQIQNIWNEPPTVERERERLMVKHREA